MKKIAGALVLTLTLITGIFAFPATAHAATLVNTLIIGDASGAGVTVVSGGVVNPSNVGSVGDVYWYDETANTLYLNGIDLSSSYVLTFAGNVGLYVEGDLSIVVCDGTTNTLGSTGGATSYSYGLFAMDSGMLNISGGPAGTGVLNLYSDTTSYTFAFYTYRMAASAATQVNISHVTVSAEAGACGIYCYWADLTIDHATVSTLCNVDYVSGYDGIAVSRTSSNTGGSISISNSVVTATGGEAAIWADRLFNAENSTLTLTTHTNIGTVYEFTRSAPLWVESAASFSNCIVKADNQSFGFNSGDVYALYSDGAMTIDSSVVDADSPLSGIYAKNGILTFSGASKVDTTAVTWAAFGNPDVVFNLSKGGYVQMDGDPACIAVSPHTITLMTENVLSSPVGGSIGQRDGAWYIFDANNVPALSARVENKVDNPQTGVPGMAAYAAFVIVSALALAGATLTLVLRFKRRRHGA